ncbi:hypothetical protein, partial [Staphylococcus aureus]|uniref:hypothetical protein n=1 Tax=Staphylococcus aureus TaxID=1280 RepID=UPI0019169261
AGVLRTGDNIIDVVVVDTGGGGGMWGEAPRKLVLADGSEIALSDWSFTQGAALAETGFPPGPPWLGAAGRTTLYNAMIAHRERLQFSIAFGVAGVGLALIPGEALQRVA